MNVVQFERYVRNLSLVIYKASSTMESLSVTPLLRRPI